MKILVFSDSHMYMDHMVRYVQNVEPDVLVHLGDFYADATALSERFSDLPLYAVPGNCDQGRIGGNFSPVFVAEIDGVRFYLTHGHKHGVKFDLTKLKIEAKRAGADAALFGHTHQQYQSFEDGLWVMNPGSCGAFTGQAALIVTEDSKISNIALLAL